MKILLYFLFVIATFLCSCENKDGDWEPMKWETNTPNKQKNYIEVPNSGNIYVFKCRNYDGFWLHSILENNITKNIDNEQSAIGKWFSIDIEKNIMKVIISPNDSSYNRTLSIELTAGNIFDLFLFEQKKTEEY